MCIYIYIYIYIYIFTSIGQINYSYSLHNKVKEDEHWREIVKKNWNLKCRDCKSKTRPALIL